MPGVVQVPPQEELPWALSLGYFIWSMGQIEWQAYEWGLHIGGHTLKDELIEQSGFGGRYLVLLREISRASWPDERKRRAKTLWRKAKCFSKFRNLVAHNPVIMMRNQPGMFVVIDAKSMKGSSDRHLRYYRAQMIYQVAGKMQNLASELTAFWPPTT